MAKPVKYGLQMYRRYSEVFKIEEKYKAILFDLDYTLYNENKFLRKLFSSQIFTNPIFAAKKFPIHLE